MKPGPALQPELFSQPASPATQTTKVNTKRQRDPLLSHPAVMLYREVCRLWPNNVQRAAIAEAIGESEKSLALYREVLTQFMKEGQPKHRVDWTLERFQKAQPEAMARPAPQPVQPIDMDAIERELGCGKYFSGRPRLAFQQVDFPTITSAAFHHICRISSQLNDFITSAAFHHICAHALLLICATVRGDGGPD